MDPRGMAADQLLAAMGGGGDAPPPGGEEMPAQDAALAGEEAGAMDLETALAGVDSAINGMDETIVREIRTHIEAIRDIASREPGSSPEGEAPADEGMPPEAPSEDLGASPSMGEEQPL